MEILALVLALLLVVLALVVVARIISGTVWLASTKKCPNCAERVKIAANVCKHCGHKFVGAEA